MNRCLENEKYNESCGMCSPIYECPEERVCERFIIHEVPQE